MSDQNTGQSPLVKAYFAAVDASGLSDKEFAERVEAESIRIAALDRAAQYRRLYAEAIKDLEARWTPQGAPSEWSGVQRSMARSAAQKIALERLESSEVTR